MPRVAAIIDELPILENSAPRGFSPNVKPRGTEREAPISSSSLRDPRHETEIVFRQHHGMLGYENRIGFQPRDAASNFFV